jgi:RND family efflux transporter MFP subunit
MTEHTPARFGPIPTKGVVAVAAIAALVLLLLYLQGTIGGHKVRPGNVPLETAGAAGLQTAVVEKREVSDMVDWPGTVRSRSVANVAPKVMARVLEVHVSAGATVKHGDTLAVLDDREIKSRAEQARAALAAAAAQAKQADADLERARMLFKKQAATQESLDAAVARAKGSRAQVAQARDGLGEVQVMLGDTTLRAPFDGVVAERLADPGDMAVPGKPLIVIQDPQSLRLEANVGEYCAGRLSLGQEVPVRFETPPRDVSARIDVIAPMADPQSRTFLIKAALPAQADLRSGTFGTMRVSCGTHQALLVPAAAVTRTGQLEAVQVLADSGPRMRHVRTGKTYGDQVEVLSGLQEGEKVVVGAARS